ncbi:hypothetical protein [Methylobacter luteus]|uniref:hypothetical protein n=1 Tax=Methylobacter luteus TaxID=415 RepID=UPI000413797B|nr:hypothetical protein [Methylobacter luteus]
MLMNPDSAAVQHQNDSEKLCLVGDIIDFWALSKKTYGPEITMAWLAKKHGHDQD